MGKDNQNENEIENKNQNQTDIDTSSRSDEKASPVASGTDLTKTARVDMSGGKSTAKTNAAKHLP